MAYKEARLPALKTEKNKLWKRGKKVITGIVIFATVVGVYEAIPPVHKAINNFFRIEEFEDATTNFNNDKDSGIISSLNTIVLDDLKVIDGSSTIPEGYNPQHTINLLCPIQDVASDVEIKYQKKLLGDSAYLSEDSRKYAKEYDVKDIMYFHNVPEGSIIVAPADGQILFHASDSASEGTVSALNLFCGDYPQGGFCQLDIATYNVNSLKALVDPNLNDKGHSSSTISVKRGQPIAIVTQETKLSIAGKDRPGGTDANADILPANINLLTQIDPKSGEEKLILAAS